MDHFFIQLFEEAQLLIKDFTKEHYERDFHKQYETYAPQLEELVMQIREADVPQDVLESYANILPAYAKQTLDGVKSKRVKEQLLVDYNYAMVTYVIPVIQFPKEAECIQLAEQIVSIWNETVAKNPIQLSTYESIYEGFSKRLCYITTAVCANLGKPDDCYELQTLRAYRDTYLASTEEGRQLIEDYYACAPEIVKAIDHRPDALQLYASIYEEVILPCVRYIEEEKKEECKALYMRMVHGLQQYILQA